MPETFKTVAAWLTTSGIKILGILISLLVLSQMSRWIVKWLERFGDSQLLIRMRVKTGPLKQWGVGRELRRRVKVRFDEKGIQIPFPQRVVLWGDKDPNKKCRARGEKRKNSLQWVQR